MRRLLCAPLSRIALVFSSLCALSLIAAPALACGPDSTSLEETPLRPRPIVNDTNQTASLLLTQADQMTSRASTLDARASDLDRAADEKLVEARAIRIEATSLERGARAELLNLAQSLASQGASLHAQARTTRDQASQLRAQAQTIRQRAFQLTGLRNDSWRTRSLPTRSPLF